MNWLRNSVLDSFVSDYISYLLSEGYSCQSIRNYTHSVAHFSHWLKTKKIRLDQVSEPIVNEFLFEHLPTCKCSRRCVRSLFNVRAALKHLLIVLRSEGHIPQPTCAIPPEISEEIARYNDHLKDVHGLATKTRDSRIRHVKAFLIHKFKSDRIITKNISPNDLNRFMCQYCSKFKPASVQIVVSSLRSYLRFRAFIGDETAPLVKSILYTAQWRASTVPKSLSNETIQRLLDAFDRNTGIGKRDYAMACCLIDMGLRAGEVARLQIEDINWRSGTLVIKETKGRRSQLLPLPTRTGEAIVEYLRSGRPKTFSRALFVRHRGGVNRQVSPGVVCQRIRCASVHCNIHPSIGSHILRHSAACRMLQAGASLKEIADVLRHRRLDTTMIYAKVDLVRLRQVAAPWPGRSS